MTNESFATIPINNSKRPVIVGVSGGTGSGKTTVVTEILKALDPDDVLVIQHDSYYRDRSHLTSEERANINYDHPDALETSLLVKQLVQLLAGKTVEIPNYDFATHTRREESRPAIPCKVIVVEGILILVDPELRRLFCGSRV